MEKKLEMMTRCRDTERKKKKKFVNTINRITTLRKEKHDALEVSRQPATQRDEDGKVGGWVDEWMYVVRQVRTTY